MAKTWIQNELYDAIMEKYKQQKQRRKGADQKVENAKARLRDTERELVRVKEDDARKLREREEREQAIMTAGLEGVSAEMREEIMRLNTRLQEQIAAVQREINNVNGSISEMNERIAGLVEEFDRNLQRIFLRIEKEKGRAIAHRNQLELYISRIRRLNPEKLTPVEANQLYQISASVNSNIKEESYSAALGLAQSHIPAAAHLQERLEALNEEYESLMSRLYEQSGELSERFDTMKVPEKNVCPLPQVDMQGEMFDGDVFFWSSGIMEALEEEFSTLWFEVRTKYEVSMDLDMLRLALEKLEAMHGRIEQCTRLAYNEYYEYMRLRRLAYRVHQAMTEWEEWFLDSSGFVDEDERRAYTMQYTNESGMVACIGLIPNREKKRKNPKEERKFGETKHEVAVFSKNGGSVAICRIARDGILGRFVEAEIEANMYSDDDNKYEDGEIICADPSEFTQRTILFGDRAKDGRLSAARENIQVTR